MATMSNVEQILVDTFRPAIDPNAPYAKVMFREAARAIALMYQSEIDPLRAKVADLEEKLHVEYVNRPISD